MSAHAHAVSVLAVDDQEVFRRVARALVDASDGFSWAGEAASGAEALERLGEAHPDLVLVDMRMPGMDGLELTRRLVAQAPQVVVILVSLEPAGDLPPAIRAAGACAHVPKQQLSPQKLRELWAAHGPKDLSR